MTLKATTIIGELCADPEKFTEDETGDSLLLEGLDRYSIETLNALFNNPKYSFENSVPYGPPHGVKIKVP